MYAIRAQTVTSVQLIRQLIAWPTSATKEWSAGFLAGIFDAEGSFSQTVLRKNLLQSLIGEQLELPARVWERLNLAWVAFFALMGLLNLYVAYTYSTSVWAPPSRVIDLSLPRAS